MSDTLLPDKLHELAKVFVAASKDSSWHPTANWWANAAEICREAEMEIIDLRESGMVLSPEASKRFIELLENPPAPSADVIERFRRAAKADAE